MQAGLRADPRPERRPPGGRRSLPAHAARRLALQHRRRVPPPGARTGRTSRCAPACSSQRIVFEGDRAVGVEVVRDGTAETMRAEREVILSAGAYQSPVLLMLSGIGPPGGARAASGSPVRENLPVGRNLQDHCMVQRQLPDRRADALRHLHAGELRAARERGPRAAHLEHPGGRRLLPHAARPAGARRRVPLRAVAVLRRGADRAD